MGVKLGHFELYDEIGQGGMGTVFRAFDPSLKRNVAIKLLDADFAKDPQFVEEFLREAQCAAAISHAQIVPIHFVGEHEGHYYIVMELLKGRSLSAIVHHGPMTEQAALGMAINIAEALKAAYTNNEMIHGDIKPQNIFVTESNGAKLLDFGLAKLANVEVAVSEGVWGSPHYMSPERVGRKAEDFRSDIYSLGATLFEALVGHPPFEADTATELAIKRLREEPPLLRTLNRNISRPTEHIINTMLAKSPSQRYADYASLISDLRKAEAVLEAKGGPATETSGMFRAAGQIHATGKSPLALILIAFFLVILAGAVALVMVLKKNEARVITAAAPTPLPAPQATPQPVAASTPQPAASWPQPVASMPSVTPLPIASVPVASPPIASLPVASPPIASVPVASPFPPPPATPSPTPAPMEFNLAALAASPGDWPQTITLAQAVTFPAVIDGKAVGEVTVAPGTPVRLVNMEAGQLVVEFQGGAQTVPVDATNLVQSVEAALGQKYDTLPVPGPGLRKDSGGQLR